MTESEASLSLKQTHTNNTHRHTQEVSGIEEQHNQQHMRQTEQQLKQREEGGLGLGGGGGLVVAMDV